MGEAGVAQRFGDAHVGVRQSDIFADQADRHGFGRVEDFLHHGLPFGHIFVAGLNVEFFQDDPVEAFFLQHQRHLINGLDGAVLDHRFLVNIAEQGDFFAHVGGNLVLGPADDDVRLNPDAAQLFDAVLGRFRFQFAGGGDIRNQGDMDIEGVVLADFLAHLADRLEERQALDVADRTADFGDHHVGVVFAADEINPLLDFVGDVRDDLHCAAQIIAAALLVDDRPVDLAGRHIGALGQVDIDKPFVVPEVEVGFAAVVGDEHFPVLVRAHGSGVKVDVRVEFLDGDFHAPAFQQAPQ